MNQLTRLCLVLHNHQPIGNFDGVFEQAYQDSYLPFLEIFEPYADLSISLHTSGPLMEWLNKNHPEYLDRLAALVQAGRVEIIGGAFYEPILTMIPSRDRRGQIETFTRWLNNRLGADVQGMWIPERVWEQNLTSDLAQAGIKYTLLDDFHFKNAGLEEDQLYGRYVTEDDGNLVNVFPGSERLRYLIPFSQPHETIDYLRGIGERFPGAVVVFGDDGEKFGTWPNTKKHVYEDGWLRRFFDTLVENQHWLKTTTLAESVANSPNQGKVYLPDASYREMTEWALPVERQLAHESVTHEMEHDPRWERVKQFMRGGFWRNFKVKYPESNEMYARMMAVSRRIEQARQEGVSGADFESAINELYRGQCNCSYWHGAFGGIYLPHLRNAVFNHLIAADNLLDRAIGRTTSWVEATVDDYNFDGQPEVRLSNNRLVSFIAPTVGGHLYELDVRTICHNVQASLTRRPEAYHKKVLAGPGGQDGDVASIHDLVVFKEEGLNERVHYDRFPRNCLVDHFFAADESLERIARSEAEELGDFAVGAYDAKLRRNPDRIQVQLVRSGNAEGVPLTITKGITADADSSVLEIAYLIEGLPTDREFHFGVEFNLAGLPWRADDRFFYQGDHERLGDLGTQLNLHNTDNLHLVDEWLGIDVGWSSSQAADMWTFPIAAVSQSEGGFELVHQSVAIIPHWKIRGDAEGRWSTTMRLSLDTSLAESRSEASAIHAGN